MPSSRGAYSLFEPHPSAQPRSYLVTGRGGAGNLTRAPANVTKGATATGPPSRLHSSASASDSARTHSTSSGLSSSSASRSNAFYSGRGGAGNVHPVSERAIFSFDEELERQLSRDSRNGGHGAPVYYHVGRGGAGNVTNAYPRPVVRRNSDGEDEADANMDRRSEKSVGASSVESGADVATKAMRRGLRRMWGGH